MSWAAAASSIRAWSSLRVLNVLGHRSHHLERFGEIPRRFEHVEQARHRARQYELAVEFARDVVKGLAVTEFGGRQQLLVIPAGAGEVVVGGLVDGAGERGLLRTPRTKQISCNSSTDSRLTL